MKLKALLEGYAWERRSDGSLPTIADTAAAYERKMQDQSNFLTEDVTHISIGSESAKFLIAGRDNTIRFIPANRTTLDQLANISSEEIQDTLQAYCESKTGLKFSSLWNDPGAGYAFSVDIYSVIKKLQG